MSTMKQRKLIDLVQQHQARIQQRNAEARARGETIGPAKIIPFPNRWQRMLRSA